MRRIVSKAFTPWRIAELEPHIHAIVDDVLSHSLDSGAWDFVSGFSGPLPAIVTADMLGVQRADHATPTSPARETVR